MVYPLDRNGSMFDAAAVSHFCPNKHKEINMFVKFSLSIDACFLKVNLNQPYHPKDL